MLVDFYIISGLMLGFEWVQCEEALVVDFLFIRVTMFFGEQ